MSSLPTLMERYVHHRKLRAIDHRYTKAGKEAQAEPNFTVEVTSVADKENIKVHYADRQGSKDTWLLVTPQVLYDLRENAGKGTFALEKRITPTDNYLRYEDARCVSSLMLPMLYHTSRTLECVIQHQGGKSFPKIEVVAITQRTLHDAPVTEVAIHEHDVLGVWFRWLYYDPQNAWILRKQVLQPPQEVANRFSRSEMEIQYADSPEGYPLPTRYVLDKIDKDGTRRHERVVEILEYSRYTPDRDEMTLASFGLTESGAPAKSSRWLWGGIIAAAASALLCGLFVWRGWRKSKQQRSAAAAASKGGRAP